jgi:transposase
MQAVTIGLDSAKSVFQAHGVDGAGEIVLRRRIRRAQLLEFCSGSSRRCNSSG